MDTEDLLKDRLEDNLALYWARKEWEAMRLDILTDLAQTERELAKQFDATNALRKLESATVGFLLNSFKYMSELPKDGFEELVDALTEARQLLKGE